MLLYTQAMNRLVAGLAVFLVGCSTTGRNLNMLSPARWKEEVQKRGVDPEEVPNTLFVTEIMRQQAFEMAGPGEMHDRLQRLQEGLFNAKSFPFSYDVRTSLTAAEAFHRREGNCLSFTNLFVALGRSLGIPVGMALVLRVHGSEREGDLIVVNNHVIAHLSGQASTTYYDFDRSRRQRPALMKYLDDLWITTLYLNNRGADELRAGHVELARQNFANAVKLTPEFSAAWGNLGVAERRLGRVNAALDAYAQALDIEPDNPTILTNLAALYNSLGKPLEAQKALQAGNLSRASPHALLVRGDLELAQGRVQDAIRLFKRARRAGPALADPLVSLARAEVARSRWRAAERYLEKALRLDPDAVEAQSLLARVRSHSGTS